MGTVHAKSVDREEPDESGSNDRVDLQGLKAQVQRVHVTGLGRTKDDIVISSVSDVFQARDFQTVILKIHEARTKLEGLGCFKGVDVLIDTYEGGDAMKEGIQVTFDVKELNLLGARVNTAIGVNEAIANGGATVKNIFGRGEEFSTSYSRGTKRTTSFGANYVKPFHNPSKTKLTTSLYQSCLEAGWSSYKELDRGVLLGLAFSTAPNVSQQVILDTAWRQLSCLSKSAAFAVREHCGHTLKSAVRHELALDTRDDHVFPADGQLFRIKNEIAGFGGNIGFMKNEANAQVNVPLPFSMVLQGSASVGHMLPLSNKGTTIADRFTMGGPMTLRGFQMGGVGPHSDNCALGAEMFWSAGLHVFTPLPLLRSGTFTDRFRLHFWTNLGNIGDWKLGDRSRQQLSTLVRDTRLSYGAGVALNVFYCFSDKLWMGCLVYIIIILIIVYRVISHICWVPGIITMVCRLICIIIILYIVSATYNMCGINWYVPVKWSRRPSQIFSFPRYFYYSITVDYLKLLYSNIYFVWCNEEGPNLTPTQNSE